MKFLKSTYVPRPAEWARGFFVLLPGSMNNATRSHSQLSASTQPPAHSPSANSEGASVVRPSLTRWRTSLRSLVVAGSSTAAPKAGQKLLDLTPTWLGFRYED